MHYQIETNQEANGRWVTRVPALPGLAAFGDTERESLSAAKDLANILLPAGEHRGVRILGFYPGRIPDYAKVAGSPAAD